MPYIKIYRYCRAMRAIYSHNLMHIFNRIGQTCSQRAASGIQSCTYDIFPTALCRRDSNEIEDVHDARQRFSGIE